MVRKSARPSKLDNKAYQEMQRAWEAYIRALQSAPTKSDAVVIDEYIGSLDWDSAEQDFIDAWGATVDDIFVRTFNDERLRGSLMSVINPKMVDGKLPRSMFELDNPFATEWAKEKTATLVREVLSPTRDAIRETIASGFTENKTVDQIARMLAGWKDRSGEYHPGVIGLLSRDQQAVSLMFDRLVNQDGVAPDEAMKQSSRYAEDLLRSRGRTIARTEVKDAQEAGKQVSWKIAEQEGLLLDETRKVWITGANEMTCEACLELDGVEIEIDEEFDAGDHGMVDMPPAHPNCTCSVVLRTRVKGMAVNKEIVEKYSPDQERDDHGEWTDGGGSRPPKKQPRSAKSRKALATHKVSDTPKQRHADARERWLAKQFGQAKTFDTSNPIDIHMDGIGIEVKTFCDQKNGKCNVHAERNKEGTNPVERKYAYCKRFRLTGFTVVIDDRDIYEGGAHKRYYSGTKLWVKKGFGAFNQSAMKPMKSIRELKAYIRANR